MRIEKFIFLLLLMTFPSAALAQHHPDFFHSLTLEADVGDSREGTIGTWDLNGWFGSDYNKLWIKSEGEMLDSDAKQAEIWALYSRNVAEFWDAQIGLRQDTEPQSTTYLVVGVEGLAKYFFETEAHLFLSDEGDVSARLRQENDLLLTQRLIAQPYFEINLSAQDTNALGVGAGFVDGEAGVMLRYEITRKFAPYLDVRYERSFGETAHIVRANGGHPEDLIASVGLRLMF